MADRKLPPIEVPLLLRPIEGFVEFIREQGVVGLAVGLVLGTAVKEVVDSIVHAFIEPLLGLLLPKSDNLASAALTIGGSTFKWGLFVSVLIRFTAIAAVIYFIIHQLRLDHLDEKKQK